MYSTISTGISNLLQPAQAELVLGQLSTYLASWLLSNLYQSLQIEMHTSLLLWTQLRKITALRKTKRRDVCQNDQQSAVDSGINRLH
jgi:hypothetical protein